MAAGAGTPSTVPRERQMAATTRTDETVSTDAQIDDVVLERRSWNYGYIGEDVEGRHHHVDRKLERIVVTKARADRDNDGAVPTFTLEGPILHATRIDEHEDAERSSFDDDPDAEGKSGLEVWIEFVDDEIGWDHRPVSAVDQMQDILGEVF